MFFAASLDVHWTPLPTAVKSVSAAAIASHCSVVRSSLVRVKVAPATSFSPVMSRLSIWIAERSSLMVKVFPSSDFSTSPFVTSDTVVTTPFFTTKVKVEIVVNPFGAVISSSSYVPSGKAEMVTFPLNVADVVSSVILVAPIWTLFSVACSSFAVSLNSASSAAMFPPSSAFLLIWMVLASLVMVIIERSWPSVDTWLFTDIAPFAETVTAHFCVVAR